jgi:tyrosyl-tRNA synthetase
LDPAEIERILALPPRDAKAALAFQLVKRLRGEEAARQAEEDFDRKFRQRSLPDDIPEFTLLPDHPRDLLWLLAATGLANSRAQAKQALSQGGVYVNQVKIDPENFQPLADGDVLQLGKRRFVRVRTR